MKSSPTELKRLVADFFLSEPEVSAVYLFGSQADGTAHANSDIDIAVLFRKGLATEFYVDRQLYLGGKLCAVLGRDDVDLVVLNLATSSELKYSIIQDGEVLIDRDPNLAEYEIRITHEYYDHLATLRRAGFDDFGITKNG